MSSCVEGRFRKFYGDTIQKVVAALEKDPSIVEMRKRVNELVKRVQNLEVEINNRASVVASGVWQAELEKAFPGAFKQNQ